MINITVDRVLVVVSDMVAVAAVEWLVVVAIFLPRLSDLLNARRFIFYYNKKFLFPFVLKLN